MLGPSDGLEAFGEFAGASDGLDAAADPPLGPSELDDGELEELEAASTSDGATTMAVRRIMMSARARATFARELELPCCVCVLACQFVCWWLMRGALVALTWDGGYFWVASFALA